MSHADPVNLAQPGSMAQAELVHGHEAHNPFLAHQFDDLQQQKDASNLGMWAFLATEVMFFGGMFTAFIVYRIRYPLEFIQSSHHMQQLIGTINTGVLLVSSFTVALSVAAAQEGKRKQLVGMLLLTILLGTTFLGLKAYEYYLDYREYLLPFTETRWVYDTEAFNRLHAAEGAAHPEAAAGHSAKPEIPRTPGYSGPARIYFSLYFVMTGIHATHMIIGLVIFGIIAFKAWRGAYAAEYYNPVEVSGLYWHFVDIVWIFLFPLLYLLH